MASWDEPDEDEYGHKKELAGSECGTGAMNCVLTSQIRFVSFVLFVANLFL
jgi:hypothetical protein